ncbi:tRNA 2-methylthio-N6-isopentenyl adenosine(37) hydroxylase MiaE-like protein [Ornithinimicrobium ciconiae]|uniref:tRNA 2-methylthio-N6-isopentenyl adenosine(37) hydroxylase MiaE-like protein n=1 Tax=Ornithinimicrobium ciconiae TaxID=2594265 RepID=A0A516G8T6_9MICO|nr:ferritin-like fold-containing protein [Ornithinimicrobium ciconiae]QDO87905.1 tRNA 2-methylthio-N6-isopentenyl adenosine(37) hydroxylase MiaE-like protein [Ornithinimicrobium ciconiae]
MEHEQQAGIVEPRSVEHNGPEPVTELLGAIGYAELVAGLRMAADALTAPALDVRIWMGRSAGAELEHFERIAGRLRDMGRDPEAAMAPFTGPVDAFHERTRPRDWLEALVKVYVGDGIARDFYREIAQHVDQPARDLIESVLQVDAQEEFAVRAVTDAIELDPTVAGRLALWARRLVGEAIAQTQYVALERDALMGLLVGGEASEVDLADLGRMFTRLMELHGERMARLGLTP